jgi:type III secretion system HrpE/YscL family protein
MARVIKADQTGPKVIPAQVVDATQRARAIVARAQEQAEALMSDAVAQGRAQGRAELAAQLLQLAADRERMLAAIEPQAIEVAMLAAGRVIGQELSSRPELIAQMVAPLLERVRRAKSVVLRVHPDDRAALEPCLASLRDRSELSAALQIETDPQLSRGSIIVVSELGSLDARVETQLDALSRALGPT